MDENCAPAREVTSAQLIIDSSSRFLSTFQPLVEPRA
jgi:hypothetical protein